jgi:hypothetical protein
MTEIKIKHVQLMEHLNSKNYAWEISDCEGYIVYQDWSEFGIDKEVDLILPTELFNKHKYVLPSFSNGNPCDVISAGNLNIMELHADERNDEWDDYEICQVFFDNINQIKAIKI